MSIQSISSSSNYFCSSFSAYINLTSQQIKIAILATVIFTCLIGIYIHNRHVIKKLDNNINNIQDKWADLNTRMIKLEAKITELFQ